MQINWDIHQAQMYLKAYIQFINPKSRYSRHLKGKKELIAKAMGKKDRPVLDLTAGLGEDAWILARLGYRVTAIEKNPFLYQCLIEAHQVALLDPDWKQVAGNIYFLQANSLDYLMSLGKIEETIYLDPMFDFPSEPKALPRKEMQAMRALLKNEDSGDLSQKLLDVALSKKPNRVVMKNPKKSVTRNQSPSYQVVGKAMKFDVYLLPSERWANVE
jgi:16S rRNA (guanine1516-N2)-methyltransferase